MLTAKQILSVGQMLNQTGETRGFSNDWSPSLSTASSRKIANNFAAAQEGNPDSEAVRISLAYEEDPLTGDVRIVPK